MSISRCSQCHLLLTPDETVAGKCPDCATPLADAPTPPAVPEPVQALSPAPAAIRSGPGPTQWIPTACLLFLGLGAGVVCFPLLTALAGPVPGAPPKATPPPSATAAVVHANPAAVARADVKPPPAPPVVVEPTKPTNTPEPTARARGATPNQRREAATVIRLDRPGMPYVVEPLGHAAEVQLIGKVKTLIVGRVEGHSVLDASKLEAKRIILSDAVGDGSVIRLNAPNGIVEIRSKVDGRSVLEINAPDGTVTFAAPYETVQGSKVGGDSEAAITARVVDFQGAVDGARTKVEVTFTRGGVLRFKEVAGASRLYYRKSDAADPELVVERGRVTGGAELKQVQ